MNQFPNYTGYPQICPNLRNGGNYALSHSSGSPDNGPDKDSIENKMPFILYTYIYYVLVIYHILAFSNLNFVNLGYIILFAFQCVTLCRNHTVDHTVILSHMSQIN